MINSMARSLVTAKKWYRNMLAGNPQYSDMELISTAYGTGSNATITFSSIPADYKHLQLRVVARNTNSTQYSGLVYRFNGDSGSNYSNHRMYGFGSGVSAQASANDNLVNDPFSVIGGGSVSNVFATGVLDILDYASTAKYKTVRILSGCYNSGTENRVNLGSSAWRSTSAITSISIEGSNNFAAGSRISLYGIKG